MDDFHNCKSCNEKLFGTCKSKFCPFCGKTLELTTSPSAFDTAPLAVEEPPIVGSSTSGAVKVTAAIQLTTPDSKSKKNFSPPTIESDLAKEVALQRQRDEQRLLERAEFGEFEQARLRKVLFSRLPKNLKAMGLSFDVYALNAPFHKNGN
jgi:hypothetical protein